MIKNKYFLFCLVLMLLNGCYETKFEAGGIFNKSYIKYRYFNYDKTMLVEIDNEKLYFYPLGLCGNSASFFSFILPLPIPINLHKNNCQSNGFTIHFIKLNKTYELVKKIDDSISFQLKYNNTIYDPMTDYKTTFLISDFESFKRIKDKTLIIHKKRDDGTIITKEIPFRWKVISNL